MHQCLNEVLRGFGLDDIEVKIGIEEPKILELIAYLDSLPDKSEVPFDLVQTVAFRNSLRETLCELGIEEFHARTGYDFDEGEAILLKLSRLIKDPGPR
jgi:hypothetical protein